MAATVPVKVIVGSFVPSPVAKVRPVVLRQGERAVRHRQRYLDRRGGGGGAGQVLQGQGEGVAGRRGERPRGVDGDFLARRHGDANGHRLAVEEVVHDDKVAGPALGDVVG